jgi:hypothetical protein
MTIATIHHDDELLLVMRDGFGAEEADELHELLLHVRGRFAITVDFRAVRRIEDCVMARLAAELADRPLRVVGLTGHQCRLLRYLSPERGAEALRRHGAAGEPGEDDS